MQRKFSSSETGDFIQLMIKELETLKEITTDYILTKASIDSDFYTERGKLMMVKHLINRLNEHLM